MNLIIPENRSPLLIERLLDIWESSVRATHDFLTEEEIVRIRKYVPMAIDNFQANEVTVNEQNPMAIGFYEYLGFSIYKRSELDEEGGPYPLLYMHRKELA